MEVIFGLIIIVVILFVLAAIGHLGWILIARLFGYRVKTLRVRNALPNMFCGRCGGRSILPSGTCGLCGWSRLTPAQANPLDPLTVTAEQLTAFVQAGLIDADTQGRVMAAISAERMRLKAGAEASAIPPPSAAVPPIPVLPLPDDVAPLVATETLAPVVASEEKPARAVAAEMAYEVRSRESDRTIAPKTVVPRRRAVPPVRPVEPIRPVRPPRRPLSEVLASFMEENNIRWGELIGGLLIVGCSLALVISFWAGITQRPWLQFSVFTAVTAAFFGLGLYTEHRWRLPLTSRGVLLIATLLVPLNFLAFAALSSGTVPGPLTLGAEIVAFALFAYLVWQAGKVIAPFWPELLTAGTCATSACLLILGCVGIEHADINRLYILAIFPLSAYVLTTAWMLARARGWDIIHRHGANAIFLLFGVLTFATVLALGLLIGRSTDPVSTLRRLALPMSFGGLPALATGMLLWRRIKGTRLATVRTFGTTIAIVGALVLLAGIVFAWPDPLGMLPVALCDFVALTFIALLFEIPAAHWLALPCAVIAWLIGFHLYRHDIARGASAEQMARMLLSHVSGTALAPLVILIGAAWSGLKRWRIGDARIYGRIGMLTAAASIFLLGGSAFIRPPDRNFATWIYATYALAAFALAWRTHRRLFAQIAWLLLTGSLIQAFVGYHLTSTPWPSALLAAATLAAVVSTLIARSDRQALHRLARPAHWLAAIAPLLAVAIIAVRFMPATAGRDSINVYWAGAVVLFIAIVQEAAPFFIVGQAVLAGGILLSVTSWLTKAHWFAAANLPLLHPWSIQSLAIALALFCLFWKLIRALFRGQAADVGRALPAIKSLGGQCPPYPPRVSREKVPPVPSPAESRSTPPMGTTAALRSESVPYGRIVTPRRPLLNRVTDLLSKAAVFDREVSAGLLLIALVMAMFSAIPAVGMELFPTAGFRFSTIHLQSSGVGAWLLVAILALLFLVAIWESANPVVLIALLATIWIACPLLAVRAAQSGVAASALRWLCAGYFLACSIPLWLRHFVPASLVPNRFSQRSRSLALPIVARAGLLVFGVIPVLVLTAWSTLLLFSGEAVFSAPSNTLFGMIGRSLSDAMPLTVIGLVFVGDAITERSEARAFAASIFFCLPCALVHLLGIAAAQKPFDGGDLLRLLQIVALVMAFFAIGWLLLRELVGRLGHITGVFPGTLKLQVAIALLLNAVVLLPAGICLAIAPDWAATFVGPAGGPWALAALLSAVAAGIFSGMLRRDRLTVRDLTMASLALAAMVGLTFVNLWPGRGWRAFHAMLSADVAAAWAMLAFGWWIVRRRRAGSILANISAVGFGFPGPSPLYSGERVGVRGRAASGAEHLEGSATAAFSHDSPLSNTSPLTPTLSPEYGGEGARQEADPSATASAPVLTYQQPDSVAAPLPVYFGGQNAQAATLGAATAVSMLVTALAIRALAGDPAAPGWSMGAAGMISLLFVTIACWARRPGYLYPAGLLLNFAAATFYLYRGWGGTWSMLDFVSVQVVAAAIPGIAWLVLELHVFRPGPIISRRHVPAFHHLAAMGSTALALYATACIVSAQLAGIGAAGNPLFTALALASAGALMLACLWDYKARYVAAGLYALGLGVVALLQTLIGVSPHWLRWALVMDIACYALVTSFFLAHDDDVADFAARFGLPVRKMFAGWWLPPGNMALGAITMIAAAIADFSLEPRSARLVIATAAIAQTLTLELLAERGRWRIVRSAALWTLAGGAVLWGWAWLPIDEGLSLNRCAITFITTALLTFILGLLLPRRLHPESRWLPAVRKNSAFLLFATVLALAAALAVETLDRSNHPAMRWHGIAVAVLVTILGACVLALESALRPGSPPRFSASQRKGLVYGAEALLAIAFFHLRISEPQLFGGFLRPYWPLVVMAIAFIGVGAAEVLRRQGRHILSEPLERTGIFMPLLPVIGWWLAPAAAVGFGQVLLIVAAFYAIVGAMRRSLAFAAVAALAANGAFWDALAHSQKLGFLQHPQLWLIPASMCLLAGAQFNRDRLTHDALRTIRYACLVLIYTSSTADIFLNGVNHTPWLPLVLVALSVGGVFLGVLFRIRAFLFLGSSFLFLSIITMIWFASSEFHWAWIWYVAGILLGTGILAIFALFEKKKEQMLALIEGLKQWE